MLLHDAPNGTPEACVPQPQRRFVIAPMKRRKDGRYGLLPNWMPKGLPFSDHWLVEVLPSVLAPSGDLVNPALLMVGEAESSTKSSQFIR
jgi:hypothetical protein